MEAADPVRPHAFEEARTVLQAAMAVDGALETKTPSSRRTRRARWGRRRTAGFSLAAVGAAAAAVALGVTMAAPNPAAGGKPAAGQETRVTSLLSYSIDTTPTSTPASVPLDAAAEAIGRQAGSAQGPNIDWSEPYFHTAAVNNCQGGQSNNGQNGEDTWLDLSGYGVIQDSQVTGQDCTNVGTGAPTIMIPGGPPSYRLGHKSLTQAQVDQLPANPNQLWPALQQLTGPPSSRAWNDLFGSIAGLVTSQPLSPAFSKALLEDAAKIPGVPVEGKYTDSLGRTGTVLSLGTLTIAIDTKTGQILSSTQNAIPGVPICGGNATPDGCQPDASTTTIYVSQQLVSSVPQAVGNAFIKARNAIKDGRAAVATPGSQKH
jgi:hypothetical protein